MVKQCFELLHMGCGTVDAVDAFDVQTEQVHCLHALIDDHWYGSAISSEQLF